LTHQILNLLSIAHKVAELKGFGESERCQNLHADLDHIHEKIKLTIEGAKDKCKGIAKYIMKKESIYILAKGEALAIAK
jgi:glucosamine 6-phosphate synthetase-like amidotransferase/phosphosugar isomerase protein